MPKSEDSGFASPNGVCVAIVGLGLMGGSLAAALRKRCPDWQILGVSRRRETIERALEIRLIDNGSEVLGEIVPLADLVVLATPVRTILGLIGPVTDLLGPEAVLTDLGSTKAEIIRAMGASRRHESCVGGHPMCGKEQRGLAAADARLFDGATWAICRAEGTTPEAVELVTGLARAAGASPLLIDAETHDAVVGRTSHLPYVAAACLSRSVARAVDDEELHALSAGGYRDTTRLAASDVAMMLDILLTNRQHVLAGIAAFRQELSMLEDLLAGGDSVGLRRYLADARRDRRLC